MVLSICLIMSQYLTADSVTERDDKRIEAAARAAADEILSHGGYVFEPYGSYAGQHRQSGHGLFVARNNPTLPGPRQIMIIINHYGNIRYRKKLAATRETVAHAARLGMGPMLYPTKDPYSIVTDYIDAPSLTFEQTRLASVRNAFIDHMRNLHRDPPDVEDAKLPGDQLGLQGWPKWRDGGFVTGTANTSPLKPTQLAAHMQEVYAEIERSPANKTFTHGDTLRRNVIWSDGKLYLVDWNDHGLGDPMRDLAKFFGFNQLMAHEVYPVLERYLERKPTSAEQRHLAMWLQAQAIDHYSYLVMTERSRMKGIGHKIAHILDLASALSDLPKIDRPEGY